MAYYLQFCLGYFHMQLTRVHTMCGCLLWSTNSSYSFTFLLHSYFVTYYYTHLFRDLLFYSHLWPTNTQLTIWAQFMASTTLLFSCFCLYPFIPSSPRHIFKKSTTHIRTISSDLHIRSYQQPPIVYNKATYHAHKLRYDPQPSHN
jgi:hypothetical protein